MEQLIVKIEWEYHSEEPAINQIMEFAIDIAFTLVSNVILRAT